jgi:alcohol dehydrogenase
MVAFDFQPRTRVLFGPGSITRAGQVARELRFQRTLVVADPGIREAGHTTRLAEALTAERIETFLFDAFGVNPDTAMVDAGAAFARPLNVDSIVGIGGGSSLDCAKGINFVLRNGGAMGDYRGYGKASTPLLPMVGIPTTAGTGSEAQSYAVISDARTHTATRPPRCASPSSTRT